LLLPFGLSLVKTSVFVAILGAHLNPIPNTFASFPEGVTTTAHAKSLSTTFAFRPNMLFLTAKSTNHVLSLLMLMLLCYPMAIIARVGFTTTRKSEPAMG
jgi:hypothetical protein